MERNIAIFVLFYIITFELTAEKSMKNASRLRNACISFHRFTLILYRFIISLFRFIASLSSAIPNVI